MAKIMVQNTEITVLSYNDKRIMGSVLLCCKPNNWSIF